MLRVWVFLLHSLITPSFAKRMPPPILTPLEVEKNQIQVRFVNNPCLTRQGLCSFQVFVTSTPIGKKGARAFDWKTVIYESDYIKDLERDIQEIHPKSLELKDGLIQVTDEFGSTYRIDPKTGFLISPHSPLFYENWPQKPRS
ncbi:MAG: hypothetical protein JNL01_07110 [Bdellovibrionales bacterium]|nr:hypothetical protein [Bdellovibrionales bacterium]